MRVPQQSQNSTNAPESNSKMVGTKRGVEQGPILKFANIHFNT